MLELFAIGLSVFSLLLGFLGIWFTVRFARQAEKLQHDAAGILDSIRFSVEGVVTRTLDAALNRRDDLIDRLERMERELRAAQSALVEIGRGSPQRQTPALRQALDTAGKAIGSAQVEVKRSRETLRPLVDPEMVRAYQHDILGAMKKLGSPASRDVIAQLAHAPAGEIGSVLEHLEQQQLVRREGDNWSLPRRTIIAPEE